MYEIDKEKVVKLTVGNNVRTQDSVSYKMQNVIIAGLVGSGVCKVLDNILMELTVNYSPEEVGIEYYSLEGFNIPWLNKNRKLPHMINQVYDDVDRNNAHKMFYKNVCNCLASCVMATHTNDKDEYYNIKRKNIIVLSLEGEPSPLIKSAVYTLMQYTDNHECNTSVIVDSHSCNSFTQSLVEYSGLRVATKVTHNLSKSMFGHDLNMLGIAGGYAWVMERDNPYILQCLRIPYKPDSLCSKICKFLSNDKEYNYDSYGYAHRILDTDFRCAIYRALMYYPNFYELYFKDKNFHEKFEELDCMELRKLFIEETIKYNNMRKISPLEWNTESL